LGPEDVTAHTKRKVWWVCRQRKDHVWEATIGLRTSGRGCPFCSGQKIGKDNNLRALFPEVAAEWHPTKNGKLTSAEVTPGSQRRRWWICPEAPDHVWQATPANRTGRNSGCPACAGKQVSVTNSLARLFPKIAREWDKEKNEDRPSDVTSKSSKLVWWKCTHGHSWQQTVYERTGRNRSCKKCKALNRK